MPAISFEGRHFQHDMILQSIRWYLASALSYRDIEEPMAERGFTVDHSTINRWVLHSTTGGRLSSNEETRGVAVEKGRDVRKGKRPLEVLLSSS